MATKKHSLWQRFAGDKNGETVLFQKPNLPLQVWAETWFVDLIITHPVWLSHLINTVNFGAIFTWAWLEIFQGSSLFRRVVGAIVMIVVVYNRI